MSTEPPDGFIGRLTHAQCVLNFALSLCGNLADAEEIAIEAFARAARKGQKKQCKETTWLCGIARNVWQEMRRAKARREAHAAKYAELGPPRAMIRYAGPSDSQVAQAEVNTLFATALAALPSDEQRAAAYLHFFEDHDYSEIARALGVNKSTVMRWIDAARPALQQSLDTYAPRPRTPIASEKGANR